jgi:anti-sigma factor RsiW
VIDLTGSCRRHRAALLDFVDRGELGDHAEAALAHLDRCDRCVAELEATALTITALRRLGEAIARQEPRPDAWPRLRGRIESGRAGGFRGRSMRAAHLIGVGLVGCLVASVAIAGPNAIIEPPSTPASISEAARFYAPAEDPSRRHPPPAGVTYQITEIDLARWTGPDGIGITFPSATGAGARQGGPI